MLTVKIDYTVREEAYHCELFAFQYDISKRGINALSELTVRYYNNPDNTAGHQAFKTFIDAGNKVVIDRIVILNAQNVEIHNSDTWKSISSLQEIALGQNQMYPECAIGFMPANWIEDSIEG